MSIGPLVGPSPDLHPMMVLLGPDACRRAGGWLGPLHEPGLLALHHALLYHQTGLWGDDQHRPRSLLLVRQGNGQLEAFGAGRPEPAVRWLAGRGRIVALTAPESWDGPIQAAVGDVEIERHEVRTWFSPRLRPPESVERPSPRTRPLTADDEADFLQSAPAWALRSWRSFSDMIERGCGVVVPHGDGRAIASVAWTFDMTDLFDSIGVWTDPRYRRLGLARAAGRVLLDRILEERGKAPLWSTRPENLAAMALAESLGFSDAVSEPLWRWPARESAS